MCFVWNKMKYGFFCNGCHVTFHIWFVKRYICFRETTTAADFFIRARVSRRFAFCSFTLLRKKKNVYEYRANKNWWRDRIGFYSMSTSALFIFPRTHNAIYYYCYCNYIIWFFIFFFYYYSGISYTDCIPVTIRPYRSVSRMKTRVRREFLKVFARVGTETLTWINSKKIVRFVFISNTRQVWRRCVIRYTFPWLYDCARAGIIFYAYTGSPRLLIEFYLYFETRGVSDTRRRRRRRRVCSDCSPYFVEVSVQFVICLRGKGIEKAYIGCIRPYAEETNKSNS